MVVESNLILRAQPIGGWQPTSELPTFNFQFISVQSDIIFFPSTNTQSVTQVYDVPEHLLIVEGVMDWQHRSVFKASHVFRTEIFKTSSKKLFFSQA